MSTELVPMVWMARPPLEVGGRAKVRKLPAGTYWYGAQTFWSHADAYCWAAWKTYVARTAEDRAWVARFTDFRTMWGQS